MRFEAEDWAVVPLDTSLAKNPSVTGAKAAHLARAAVAGLPVLPGFVLVPASRAPGTPTGPQALRAAWRALSPAGGLERAVVVRSSSLYEDSETSSMAGRFDSVLDVQRWEAFVSAVQTVPDSARRIGPLRPSVQDPSADGMAVLVQPMLESVVGGVMSGADPVEGRTDRILVSVVRGGPDRLVDGSTQGERYQFTRRARPVPDGRTGRRGSRLGRPRSGTRRERPLADLPPFHGGPQRGRRAH
ncbi:PEP/pyruvate-binding domain-containing protein [Streptomyces chromofuscus]|uniref:PEP/pyruvate-binding domain-containing protein n=1 Tax=Streptomyces chromofuscus TaxID=42881 RepID=UPI00167A88D5|nr:PEP/pyruvate-binding domain-containing protein [Streptomyces chromofuscus]GGT03262.1 hypothetical protein GCM10010254_24480 [Streptomyces chromofuscus]